MRFQNRIVCILYLALLLFTVTQINTELISNINAEISIPETHIITNTTWTLTESPYFVEGNITIDEGITLTIEPGVDVLFNGRYKLLVDGTLIAAGTPTNMIRFTSNMTDPAPGDWYGIQSNITGTGHLTIKYCNITHGDTSITLFNSSFNSVLYNNIFLNDDIGIFLFCSSNNNISDNNVFDNNSTGISLLGSNNCTINNNKVINNSAGGIAIIGGSNNSISDNNVLYNLFGGISLYSAPNTNITHNEIYSNTLQGIFLLDSSSVNITNNNISNNPVGIKSWSSSNNWLYHNNLIDNTEQAIDDEANNNWDNGFVGNYWSDYDGIDNDNNGIGDSPYVIDEDSQDNFPLMNPLPDTSSPTIDLVSPANNSIIKPGTIIDFLISDFNIDSVEYTINSGARKTLTPPYDILTTSWTDGTYIIEICAKDSVGNENMRWFVFTIDSVRPIITLNSPANNSLVSSGTIIDLSVFDDNLKEVRHSINGGVKYLLASPYDIYTENWADGDYTVEVTAGDFAGNEETELFMFTFDKTAPTIISTVPTNNAMDTSINTTILIIFSESMNRISVESAFSITPTISYSIQWSDGDKIVIITPNFDLEYDETYKINIDVQASDLANLKLANSYTFEFTTEEQIITPPNSNDEDTNDGDNIEWFLLGLFILILVMILIGILIVVFLLKKKRKEEYHGSNVLPHEASQISVTSYQRITQFQCPRCNQIININITTNSPFIQCPYCGLRGTIK